MTTSTLWELTAAAALLAEEPSRPPRRTARRIIRSRRTPRVLPQFVDADNPEHRDLRMQHEGQPGNWLRIGHGCFMKKNHGR